jgi:hypothetical protein
LSNLNYVVKYFYLIITLFLDETINRKDYQKKVIVEIKEFEENYKERMQQYSEIKEENNNFAMRFKQTEKIEEFANSKKQRNLKKTDETFHDLIINYKERGYKIPDLSTDHNLFKQSPLLLENHKIEDYYRYFFKATEHTDKSSNFLLNLNSHLNERIQTTDMEVQEVNNKFPSPNSKTSKIFSKRSTARPSIFTPLVSETVKLLNEIEENLEYNKEIKKLIEEREEQSELSLNLDNSNLNQIKNINISEGYNLPNSNQHTSKKEKLKSRNVNFSSDFNTNTNLSIVEICKSPKQIKSQDTTYLKDGSTNDTTKILRDIVSKNNSQLEEPIKIQSPTNISNINSMKKSKNMKIKFHTPQVNTKFSINKDSSDKLKYANKSCYSTQKGTKFSNMKLSKQISLRNEDNYDFSLKSSYLNSPDKSLKNLFKIDSTKNDPILSREQKLNEREKYLNLAYDSINVHYDSINVKDIASNYFRRILQYDDKSIEDFFNKKIEPVSIMKSISEIKSKVDFYNVPERFRMQYNGASSYDGNANLSKV